MDSASDLLLPVLFPLLRPRRIVVRRTWNPIMPRSAILEIAISNAARKILAIVMSCLLRLKPIYFLLEIPRVMMGMIMMRPLLFLRLM